MMEISELLNKFELLPSTDFHVFGGDCIVAASMIEENYRKSTYDHRPFLPQLNFEYYTSDALLTEQYRVGYACFKREVVRVLQPKTILEIGIGLGVSALAFLDACPNSHYVGMDNNSDFDRELFLVKPSEFVARKIHEKEYNGFIYNQDSQKLSEFPRCEFVHIDGDHSRQAVRHDVALAWRSGAKWILCDDSRDSAVVGGIFDALHSYLDRGTVDWAHFSDTWTGSILIRTDRKEDK
jgi:hypothetical protein